MVPTDRLRLLNDDPVQTDGAYVLYWMTAFRRTHSNAALERALEHCRELKRPLVVLEALRAGYRWACDRFHQFVLDGMADQQQRFDRKGIRYYPYVEPEPGAGSGLLEALARDACLVVADDCPAFFLPRMVAAAASKLSLRVEAVDSNGLLPLSAAPKAFKRAVDLRRFLQKELEPHLHQTPLEDPLKGLRLPEAPTLPAKLKRRWPEADLDGLDLGQLPIDHEIGPVPGVTGGSRAGRARAQEFVNEGLDAYLDDRNQPEAEATSGLSPYLHFGHVSVHSVLAWLAEREDWRPGQVDGPMRGKREGWWHMSPAAESFLDELVTWRELGYISSHLSDDHTEYEGIPEWARESLEAHVADEREHVYDLETFARAETHDPLWNAAQRQLVREGRIHNYLRMLWGKKVLEWTAHPRDALAVLIELNNRYALDGRDPNSYSGITWCLGKFDRAWGPERPIFGKVRYMSSENTARKLRVKTYQATYA